MKNRRRKPTDLSFPCCKDNERLCDFCQSLDRAIERGLKNREKHWEVRNV